MCFLRTGKDELFGPGWCGGPEASPSVPLIPQTCEPGASPHGHLHLSCLEGRIRRAAMAGGPRAHASTLSLAHTPGPCAPLPGLHCPSRVPSVKEAGSLEAEDSSGLPGSGMYRRILESACVEWPPSPKLGGDVHSSRVVSYPRAQGTILNNGNSDDDGHLLGIYCGLALSYMPKSIHFPTRDTNLCTICYYSHFI